MVSPTAAWTALRTAMIDAAPACAGDADPFDRPHCTLCLASMDPVGTPKRPFRQCGQCGAARLL